MTLPRDLVEMLGAFDTAGVRYLVIGGHAVALHAKPRSTKDLDVLLDPARENVARACRALAAFGVPRELVETLATAGPTDIVWLGRPPARIDLLLGAPGVDFPGAWARRVVRRIDGIDVTFIGRDDLIANKRAVDRPRDRADVRALLKAGGAAPAKRRARRR